MPRHCHFEEVNIDASDLEESLDAMLGVRSLHTIVKRTFALLSFFRWYSRSFTSQPFAFGGTVIWTFLKELKDDGAAPTRLSSYMSAFRFVHYVLGVRGLKEVISSRRLSGLAALSYAWRWC